MKKLKSNDLHTPLQFISPYTPEQCQSLIQTSVTDTNRVLFTKTDDSLIQFRINFRDGLTEYIATGSLRSLIGGEQTQVTCQVKNLDTKTGTPFESPMIDSPKEKNLHEDVFGLILFTLISIGIFLLIHYILLHLLLFPTWLISWLSFYIIPFLIAVLIVLVNEMISPKRRNRRHTDAEAKSIFYARLIELLAEQESSYNDDGFSTAPLQVEPKNDKYSEESHTNKNKHGNNAPLQFVSPYTLEECQSHLKREFSNSKSRVFLTLIDDKLTMFQIVYRIGSAQIQAQGSLKSWVAGEQTHISCQIQRQDETSSFLPDFFLSKETRSIEQAKSKAESLLYDRLVALLAEPESA